MSDMERLGSLSKEAGHRSCLFVGQGAGRNPGPSSAGAPRAFLPRSLRHVLAAVFCQATGLVQYLKEWDSEERSLKRRLLQLCVDLYERGIFEKVCDVACGVLCCV